MRCPTHLFNFVSRALPGRSHGVRRRLLRACGARLAPDVRLHADVRVYGANLRIGAGTWISSESVLIATASAEIAIGGRCDIGPRVMLVTGTHALGGHDRRAGAGEARPIIVGDGCWIGAGSTILGGARIGDGCVVAAGAVVLPGDYPADSLLAGVPAQVKKRLPA
jgi:acetyltransferase-like isoleucine patch superfamily enzyme